MLYNDMYQLHVWQHASEMTIQMIGIGFGPLMEAVHGDLPINIQKKARHFFKNVWPLKFISANLLTSEE